MVSRNRKIARRIGQAVANDVLDISGAISAGAGVTVYATADDLPTTGLTAGDEAFVSGSNRLYISNGTGWYSIGLVNTNPAITSVEDPSSNTTPFTLATDGSALVLTITAADPEDIPLTYSYAVTTGSLTNGGGTTATVVQGTGANTNQFTITPTTTEAYSGTFDLTFTTSDGINQASSVNSFTLNFITSIANSNYTTLLATVPSFTAVPYSFADLSYQNKSFSFSSQGSMNAVQFNANGTKIYAADYGNDIFYQYSLNPAWDISTASYDNVSLAFDSYSVSYTGLWFKPDGSVMYAADNANDSIDIWTVSSGSEYVLNQYSYSSTKSLSAISGITDLRSIIFKSDGSKFFALCNDTYAVYEFTMSTAWDVANAQHSSSNTYNVNTATGENNPRSIYVTPDGTQLLMSGSNLDKLHRFVLTTPWQVNSATYTSGDDFDFSGQAGTNIVRSILDGDSGKILYLSTSSSNTMFQYNFESVPKIIDSSSNSHSITVSGNPYAGTFSPYRSGGYSQYFNASNYATISNFNQSITGNFTVECWVYVTGSNAGDDTFLKWGQLRFRSNNDSAVRGVSNIGGFMSVGEDNINTPNRWVHVVLDRSGNTLKAYKNGINFYHNTNYTASQVGHSGDLYLGWDGSSERFIGYIRDLRIVSESLYGSYGTSTSSANFDLPTSPLQTNANTILLACSGPFLDDRHDTATISNNASFTLTGTGPVPKPFSPYDYNEYSAADHGGSINYDGTGDYLTIPDHSSLNFGSNDWTIECWIYPRTNVGDCGIWHQSASGGTDWFSIYLDGSFNPKFVLRNNNAEEWAGTAAANTAPQNTWTHIALVRRFGTDIKMYANGKVVHTETQHLNVALEDKSYNHVIGYERFVGNGTYFDGLISDFKIDIGTAHYTAEFTPPTAPLSSTAADLHIKGTAASIIDKSQGANLKLVGNTTGSTTQVKFAGSKSMYFDGSGDYLETSSTSFDNFNFGTGDFTVEFFLRNVNQSGYTYFDILGTANNGAYIGSNRGGWMLSYYTSQFLKFNYQYNNTWVFENSFAQTLNIDTWYHIAVTRQGTQLKCFVDGNQAGSTITNSTNLISTEPLNIGRGYGGGVATNSYIQDVRITKGLARYTSNFTPPTAEFEG